MGEQHQDSGQVVESASEHLHPHSLWVHHRGMQ